MGAEIDAWGGDLASLPAWFSSQQRGPSDPPEPCPDRCCGLAEPL